MPYFGDGSNISSVSGVVPVGGIIMWSGATNAVPSGWALCDGQNGTPNLQDKFVVGAGSSYSVNDTGGAADVTLTTAQIPSHTHPIQIRVGKDDDNFSFNQGFSSDAPSSGGTYNSNSTGGGQSHENRPPYYALAYIIKT
jgi:microcystin-dependent protein